MVYPENYQMFILKIIQCSLPTWINIHSGNDQVFIQKNNKKIKIYMNVHPENEQSFILKNYQMFIQKWINV